MRYILLTLLLLPLALSAQKPIRKPTQKPPVKNSRTVSPPPITYTYEVNPNAVQVRLYFANTKEISQEYFVDTTTKKLDGYYKDYYRGNKEKAYGLYKGGYRVGVWLFYDTDGKILEKYNYDLRRSFMFNENPYLAKRVYAAMGAQTTHLDTLDSIPHFVGGMKELDFFFKKQLKQPYFAWLAQLKGTLIVSFIVTQDGELQRVRVEKSLGMGCDEEAFRVLQLMPRWAPAIKNDEYVDSYYELPIEFDCTQ